MIRDEIISLQYGAKHVQVSKELQNLKASLYKTNPPIYHEFLFLLMKLVKPKIVVELGTHDGLSMLYMLEGYPEADFYTVDINPDSGKYLENTKVKRIIGDAAECANQIPNDIDVLFEDTDHEFDTIDREYKSYYPKMKDKGVMIFDDMFCELNPGATDWWNKFNKPMKFELPVIHPKYGVTGFIKGT